MILEYNLQFFAKDGPGGEKTEEPTSKKLTDARKEGQVAKSREAVNAVMLLALFLLMKLWIGRLGVSFISFFRISTHRYRNMLKCMMGICRRLHGGRFLSVR